MKVRVLDREEPVGRNSVAVRSTDPRIHPFALAREYQRALVATKIDRIFAKPFVHSFTGHLDSVKALAKPHFSVYDVYSGSADGEIRYWSLSSKQCTRSIVRAHEGIIEGLSVSYDDKYLLSCGRDGKAKLWPIENRYELKNVSDEDQTLWESQIETIDQENLVVDPETSVVGEVLDKEVKALSVYVSASPLSYIDHHPEKRLFLTTGDSVEVWDQSRSAALQTYKWTEENYYSCRWSPSESSIFAATDGQNYISLGDIRVHTPVQRLQLQMRSNSCCFNPQKPMNLIVANEDSNLYTFDIRKLDKFLFLHHGFVNAALDVDVSPSGKEIVAGSFDQTVRIWEETERRSKDVYHSRRQQLVLCTRFSGDGKFLLCGSADMNIRVWKAHASEILGPLNRRERNVVQEREKLKEKFSTVPEIKRISQHRRVPKYIKNQTEKRLQASRKEAAKEERRRKHEPKTPPAPPLSKSVIRNVGDE